MYESIQGTLTQKDPARCVVEAGGLGYAIHISLTTYEDLPAVGSPARMVLHPVVREDEWRLFGFSAPRERETFRDLLRVNGVGPLVALALLSGFRPQELEQAVAQGDVRTLTRAKGVGKKTAERILVELRDRWKDRLDVQAPGASGTAPGGPDHDAVRALEALGLDATDAARRVARVLGTEPDLPVADVVRRALRG